MMPLEVRETLGRPAWGGVSDGEVGTERLDVPVPPGIKLRRGVLSFWCHLIRPKKVDELVELNPL